MNLHRLRLLLELRNRVTIAQVAEALSYSRSTISQQLAQLETETGVPLLQAAGRGVQLTPQGLLLCDHIERILGSVEEAEADIASWSHTVRGTLRIGIFQSAALVLLPSVLRELATRFPELTVQMSEIPSDTGISALESHRVDVIAGEEYPDLPPNRSSLLHREHFAADCLSLLVPEEWNEEPGLGLTRMHLRPWAMEEAHTEPGIWALLTCRNLGFEPRVLYRSSDLMVQVGLVAAGLACAIVPTIVLAAAPKAGIAVQPLPGNPQRRMYTLVRHGAETRPDIKAFRAELKRKSLQAGIQHPEAKLEAAV